MQVKENNPCIYASCISLFTTLGIGLHHQIYLKFENRQKFGMKKFEGSWSF